MLSCDHSGFDWTHDEQRRQWRVEGQGAIAVHLLQWCSRCGAIRVIEGTVIGAWQLPLNVQASTTVPASSAR